MKVQYKDIDLGMAKHPVTGDVAVRTDVRAIMQSIREIVFTAAGEWEAEPEFGVGIYSELGEEQHPLIGENLRIRIEQAVERYEPRAEIASVVIGRDGDHGVKIQVIFFALNSPEPFDQEIVLERTR
ncbi:lysozyme [Vibrio phage VAP7]|uniref:Lysozyme n=2 Tax=Vapseptimavirus VAP7 TaxID=2841303 RepID=A0A4Y5TV21_9CAUD|nr:lysozyme [Vibrio phage VAP7]AWY10194.1 lysozyme [Vibrio phage VP-1]QDB73203.1 lysozyme [Vibrio phage VAP7]UFD98112.1 hypothetical protein [Vibrio phage BX-1]